MADLYQIQEPKFGFEFEANAPKFRVKAEGDEDPQELPKDRKKKAKGSICRFFDADKEPAQDFELEEEVLKATAEFLGSTQALTLEVIYGGDTGVAWQPASKSSKQEQTEAIGTEITTYFEKWKTAEGKVEFAQPDTETKEKVFWKLNGTTNIATLSSHFTTSFPLSGIAFIVDEASTALVQKSSQKEKLKDVLLSDLTGKIEGWEPSEAATWKTAGLQEYGEQTTRAFLILVLTYVKNAGSVDLKKTSPIMPRTDFVAMLNLALDTMSTEGKAGFKKTLPDIVQHFNGSSIKIKNIMFKWDGTNEQLSVEQWLDGLLSESKPVDHIRVLDARFRNAQIGALENIVTTVIDSKDSTFLCPIFEFRDVGSFAVDKLTPAIKKLEEEVRSWHEKAATLIGGPEEKKASTSQTSKTTGPKVASFLAAPSTSDAEEEPAEESEIEEVEETEPDEEEEEEEESGDDENKEDEQEEGEETEEDEEEPEEDGDTEEMNEDEQKEEGDDEEEDLDEGEEEEDEGKVAK